MNRQILQLILLISVLVIGACGDDSVTPPPEDESLNIAIAAEPISFSPGSDVAITVEVENPMESRVEFGMGSSSCQFLAVIRYGEEDRGMPVSRVCTADMATWSIDPGERRSENWIWKGEVVVDGVVEQLPPGVYELRGVAGKFKGLPVTIEVVE